MRSVCFLVILGCAVFTYFPKNNEIIIPSIESVLSNGYPRNWRGETYGPNTGNDNLEMPDLLLAENKTGVIGYVKSEDVHQNPKTIEEALEITTIPSTTEIPMYLQDGVTVIGTFPGRIVSD